MAKKTEDAVRKTTIPVKDIPAIIDWYLNYASGEQLDYLDSLTSGNDFKVLQSIVADITDYNMHQVFTKSFNNPEELFAYRAALRGEVSGLKTFLGLCQNAIKEINKRSKK